MFQVEIYGRVRRAVRVEGRSQRAVAREFGLSRETVRKMLQYAVPPGYQRQQPIKRPKLGPWPGFTPPLTPLLIWPANGVLLAYLSWLPASIGQLTSRKRGLQLLFQCTSVEQRGDAQHHLQHNP